MTKHTDRELLELAAKAAGLTSHRYCDAWKAMAMYTMKNGYYGPSWNPLTDDGDALRLAVLLRIDTKHYSDHVVCWWNDYSGTGKVFYGLDSLAATRRAIVTAAAELGKERA